TFRDGTLHTGDLGYMAEGDLYVCGRLKDLIIIRGANFHPQDIERAVARLPGIRRGNVAVFSVPEAGNETLIVVAEGSVRDSDTLTGSIGEAVRRAVGVTPSDIVIAKLGALPKTTSGKLQRQKTKTLYQDGLLAGAMGSGGNEA
ncbi:MAG: acyl-CoA synthetase, partial [Myxococcales bacterium]|nr:acyl-CoA synthetase [Myxococcales bacterium]